MLYTAILNVKTGTLAQHSYANIYAACKIVDLLNRNQADTMDLVIVKTSSAPIADIGSGPEWLSFLEKRQFLLAMKDNWNKADFENNAQLAASIAKVKAYLNNC